MYKEEIALRQGICILQSPTEPQDPNVDNAIRDRMCPLYCTTSTFLRFLVCK